MTRWSCFNFTSCRLSDLPSASGIRGIPSNGERSLGNSDLSQVHSPLNQRSSGRVSSVSDQGTTTELFLQTSGKLSRSSFGTSEGDSLTSWVGPVCFLSISPATERKVSTRAAPTFSSKNLLPRPGMRLRGWLRDAISTLCSGLYSWMSARNFWKVSSARGRRGRPLSSEKFLSKRMYSKRSNFSLLLRRSTFKLLLPLRSLPISFSIPFRLWKPKWASVTPRWNMASFSTYKSFASERCTFSLSTART